MKPRAESQARTRERLIRTAEDMFLAHGYVNVRLSEIAARAGNSTGAVYSNFSGKPQLGLAVLDRVREREVKGLARAVELASRHGPPAAEALVTAIGAWAQHIMDDGAWFRLEMELALQIKDEPELGIELAARQRRLVEDLTGAVIRHAHAADVDDEKRVTQVTALLTLGTGLAVQRMIDPDVTAEPLVRALESLLVPVGPAGPSPACVWPPGGQSGAPNAPTPPTPPPQR